MADTKISALPSVSGVSATDELIINSGGGENATTSRVTLGTLLGGNEVSGIQYSSVYTSDLQVRKQQNFNVQFQLISPGPIVDGYVTTAPIEDFVSETFEVPIPANADGAIFLMYTATSVTPTDNMDQHPNYISGSTTPAFISSRSQHFINIPGVTWQTNNVADQVGWTDTHSIAMQLNDGVVARTEVGTRKRGNFNSVNQITKLDFCKFSAGSTSLTVTYSVDIQRAGFQYFEVRPVRVIVMPTQGISSASVLGASVNPEDEFTYDSEDEWLEAIKDMQMKEIRHIMTMMDAYEKTDPSVGTQFDTFRATLLGLAGNNDWADVGATIKSTKIAAAGLMNFDFGYGRSSSMGLLG